MLYGQLLSGSTFTNNSGNGDVFFITGGGTMTVNDCTISDNSDGAIGQWGSTVTVSNSVLSGNTDGAFGLDGGTLNVSDSIISNNSGSPFNSSGITNIGGGTVTVIGCTISGNSGGGGGGIYNGGSMNVSESTICDNPDGGIMNAGQLTVTNCTIAYNLGGLGSGVFNGSLTPVTLNNTIVADNTDGASTNDLYGSFSGSNDLIGDGSDLGSNLPNSLQGDPLLVGTVIGDPNNNNLPTNFLLPTANGGPLAGAPNDPQGQQVVPTFALQTGSPAINAGSNAPNGNPLTATADQRGEPYLAGNNVDIGAYESQGFAITSAGQVSIALNPTGSSQGASLTYTINWGDNTAPTVQSGLSNNGFGTPVSHSYSAPGMYELTETTTDQSNNIIQQGTALVLASNTPNDNLTFSGGSSPGQVAIASTSNNYNWTNSNALNQVLVACSGGSDAYTVNFGSTLTTPINIADAGTTSDPMTVNGDNSPVNYINKTPGQITWGSPVTETVLRTGISGTTTINPYGTEANYVNDPGGSTIINGGPGANSISVTATTGSGVVINGGPTSNTYSVDLGGLAGQVAIQNNNSGTTDNLIVNGANENNNITLSGNQITEGTQTITDSVALTNLAVNGGSGNNKITNQITVNNLTVPVQNVTLTGGGAGTTYNVNAGNVNIVGGTGQNVVNVNGGTVSSNLPLTSVALTFSTNSSLFGQQTTFTAAVSSSASGTPTGSVDFFDTSTNTDLGSGILSGGTATLTTSALGAGTHVIQAIYGGDQNFLGTSAKLTQTVNPDATTAALSSSSNQSTYSQGVAVTATVSANSPGSGTPTGSVDFFDSTTNTDLGSASLSGGIATLNISSLLAGSHSITATYSGDGNFLSSASPTDMQTVQAASTTLSNVNLSSPTVYGQPVVLSVTVSNPQTSASPSGSVTFKDGSKILGTASVGVGGTASLTVSTFAPGSHSLTASFSDPAGNFNASKSAKAVALTITQASTATSLTTSLSSAVYGEALTFTVSVAPVSPSVITPTGSVTLPTALQNW